jgi:hypothetical protein
MKNAPIAFFAFKRPDHALQSLEALSKNEGSVDSELFIFCDGSRGSQDDEGVAKLREAVRMQQWCSKVYIIEREKNMGCANNIISGITEVCEKYGRVIVIEDDVVVTPYFLKYMNDALERYQDEPRVMQISGHMFPVQLSIEQDTVFMPFVTSWGWATWHRAWKHFDVNNLAYTRLKANWLLRYEFDLNGSYPYFNMLKDVVEGRLDTWDVSWYLSTFMLGGLTLHPKHSLVKNIGFDGSGLHCGKSKIQFFLFDRDIETFPKHVVEDRKALYPIYNFKSGWGASAISYFWKTMEIYSPKMYFIRHLIKALIVTS